MLMYQLGLMRMSRFEEARTVQGIGFLLRLEFVFHRLRGTGFPELWVGCVASALEDVKYRQKLANAGFQQIEIEPTRVYRAQDTRDILAAERIDADAITPQVDGKFMSAFIRAVKPVNAKSCCGPACCN